MNRIIIFFTIIASLFMIPIPAQADSMHIDLISQSCYVRGYARMADPVNEGEGIWFYLNESGTTSVSGISPTWGVAATASSDVGESTASLDAWIPFIFDGVAYAEITFRPIGASYINISAFERLTGVDHPEVRLIDQTTSETLLYFHHAMQLIINGQDVSEQYGIDNNSHYTSIISIHDISLPVNSSHTYLLSTFAWAEIEMGTRASASISLSIPEPTTMLLLSIGLIGLVGSRKKFTSNLINKIHDNYHGR